MTAEGTAGDGPSGGFSCQMIGWAAFHRLARRLGRQIRASGFQPELLVAIGRGGLVPGRVLADQLDLFDLATLKVEHYHAMRRQRVARVRYPLMAPVAGRRVLLVDDVSDTGDSFQVAMQHLRERGEPASLKTAALHHKRSSAFKPDYFAEEVIEWRWLIYPWAVVEDLGGMLRNMTPRPLDSEQFRQRLREDHGLEVEGETLEDVLLAVASTLPG